MNSRNWNRREVLAATGAVSLAPITGLADGHEMQTKPIPATGEQLPVIGLGTYSVLDVESTAGNIESRKAIVDLLTAKGGSVIDTSPMYNRSERVIGDVIDAGSDRSSLFLATKVWIDGKDAGVRQMQESARLMSTEVIDLMQVHNLRDTDLHMQTIRDWKEEGRIRYSGLTHYRAGAHDALEAAMHKHKPDFIQINYSLGEREAENRVLPLAEDLGIAVLINRPYQAGALFRAVSGKKMPEWALEFADSWGQFFLKFIVSHPAVTCAIPATSKLHHMEDNLGAGFGPMPDNTTRRRMAEFLDS
ncbi:MAG: aldo/keto reductase [Woeseiaceae bacterium]|nr:aldo/keto reductase [Woeseiaceae bacterium]